MFYEHINLYEAYIPVNLNIVDKNYFEIHIKAVLLTGFQNPKQKESYQKMSKS